MTPILALLRAVPARAWAATCALLMALLAGQTVIAHRNATRLAEARATLAEERAAWSAAAASATQHERDRERAWTSAHQEITDAYLHVAAQLAADRRDADAVGLRLHQAARTRAGRACSDPGAAGGGTAAESPDYLLSELFARADARAGELAAFADAARAAGLACERAYGSLTIGQQR